MGIPTIQHSMQVVSGYAAVAGLFGQYIPCFQKGLILDAQGSLCIYIIHTILFSFCINIQRTRMTDLCQNDVSIMKNYRKYSYITCIMGCIFCCSFLQWEQSFTTPCGLFIGKKKSDMTMCINMFISYRNIASFLPCCSQSFNYLQIFCLQT